MIGSLCSGYGGLDLAVQAVFGQPVAWHCENEDAPSRVLEAHWPGVPNLRDLTEVDWGSVEPVDILTAGYPCQPFSHAGQRRGADDERHLWPYVAEAVRRIRPRLVVLENVAGHRSLGFGRVLGDLAALRYDVRWASVRAADVGAPHGRERVFIVAVDPDAAERGRRAAGWDDGLRAARLVEGVAADSAHVGHERGGGARYGGPGPANGRGGTAADAAGDGRHERRTEPARLIRGSDAAISGASPVADPDRNGLESVGGVDTLRRDPHRRSGPHTAWGKYEPAIQRWERVLGRAAPRPTEPCGTRGGQRLSPWFVEWMMGLPDGWVTSFVLPNADPRPDKISRIQALKMLGNGVVPQQAEAALRTLTRAAAA